MAEDSTPRLPEKDLLGDPARPLKDRRGRKSLRFDSEAYEKVRKLRGLGMELADIAAALGISEPSLRKYFLPELRSAEAAVRAQVLTGVMDKVEGGSVPAMKLALQLLDKGQSLPSPGRKRKAEPLGKKAAADEAAKTAHEDSTWGELLN